MKLHFLNPISRAAINVARLKRSGFDIREIISHTVGILDAMVILGNGTPDDKVIGILSYHLDGDKVMGIVKPEEKRHLSVLDLLKTYLGENIRTIMVLVDQDDLDLNALFDNALERIRGIGIRVTNTERMNGFMVCQCSLAGREFKAILVASGLEEVDTRTHTIEDHLATAAGLTAGGDSKQSWNSIGKNEKEEVFRQLGEEAIDTIEKLFPQQLSGLYLLEDEMRR